MWELVYVSPLFTALIVPQFPIYIALRISFRFRCFYCLLILDICLSLPLFLANIDGRQNGPHVPLISFQAQAKDLEALASESGFVDSLSVAAMILMAVLLRFVSG